MKSLFCLALMLTACGGKIEYPPVPDSGIQDSPTDVGAPDTATCGWECTQQGWFNTCTGAQGSCEETEAHCAKVPERCLDSGLTGQYCHYEKGNFVEDQFCTDPNLPSFIWVDPRGPGYGVHSCVEPCIAGVVIDCHFRLASGAPVIGTCQRKF